MKETTLEKAVKITADLVNSNPDEFDTVLFVNNLRLNQMQSVILYSMVESTITSFLLANGNRDREGYLIGEFGNKLALVLDEDYDELYFLCNHKLSYHGYISLNLTNPKA